MTETRIDEVAVLLAELPYLDRGELLALAGAQNKDQAARRVAWRAVEDAASRDASRGLESLRDEVAAWATRLGAIVGDEAGSGLADLMLADVRRQRRRRSSTPLLPCCIRTTCLRPIGRSSSTPGSSVIGG